MAKTLPSNLIEIDRFQTPLRVVAGPGTGKTHALVALYADLVGSGVPRGRILVLTFSTAAAGELERRIDERLLDSYDRAWISTFHSFCARLLRDHQPDPRRLLLSGFQEWVAMRQVLDEMDPALLGGLAPVRRSEAFAQDALAFVALLKQNLLHPAGVALLAETGGSDRMRALAAVYSAYQAALEAAHLVDFRDLVMGAISLLQSREGVLRALRDRFSHILVDEFQDVDPAQFSLLRLIAPPRARPRLVVVGDPDQSIYGFRGTLPRLLSHDFEITYGARSLSLDAGRRCPPSILAAGERLLEATQPERRARRPAGDRGEAPFAVDVSWEADAAQEALHVARRIREHMLSSRGRLRPADFAILLRSTSALSAPFEQALRALGIPFEVRGLGALARNEVVRFLLSYLAALARPDDPEALAHLLASGLSGAGRRVVSRLHAHAAEAGRPLGKVVNSLMYRLAERDPERFPLPWPAAAGGPGVGLELRTAGAEGDGPDAPAPPAYLEFLTDGELDGLHRAVTCYQRLRGQSGRLPLAALAYAVLEDAGVLARVLSSSRLPEAERTRGLADVRAALAAFEEVDQVWRRLLGGAPRLAELADSLESIVSRAVDETEAIPGAGDSVQILTVHQSKGLEFEVVFLAGFADGVFPVRAKPHPLLDEVEMAWLEANLPDFRPPWPSAAAGRLAEEARLAYVGMTRARSHLHLTYAAQYLAASGPSPFLEMALPGGEHHGPGVAVQLEPGEILTRTEAETLAARFCDDLGKGDLDALARRGCDRDFIADPRSGQAFLPYLGVRPEGVAPHHFSATDLTAYLKCPRLYWYGHHPGLVAAPRSPEMTRGGFLHKVLEEFHRREAEWRGLTAGDRREWLEKAILAHLEPYLGRVEPTLDRRREELEVRKILDNYLRFATIPQKVPRRGTLATEKRFTLVLEGAEIHGIIDRINDTGAGTCEVVDYKTGRGLTARRAYQTYFGDDPHDVQLAVYYLACREGADVDGTPLALEPRFISLWYPKDLVYGTMRQVIFAVGEPAGLKAWMEQPLTADDLERGRATVTGAIEHVRQGDFEPRPREAPGTCMSFTGCPHEGICPFARTAAE